MSQNGHVVALILDYDSNAATRVVSYTKGDKSVRELAFFAYEFPPNSDDSDY